MSEEIKIITLEDIFKNIETEEKAFKFKDYIKDLQQKVEQLEKENIKQKEIIENLTTMTVCGDKKQIKNTAQYKLEQLEKIKKEIKDRKDYRKAYYEEHKKIELLQAQLRYYKNKIKGEKHE